MPRNTASTNKQANKARHHAPPFLLGMVRGSLLQSLLLEGSRFEHLAFGQNPTFFCKAKKMSQPYPSPVEGPPTDGITSLTFSDFEGSSQKNVLLASSWDGTVRQYAADSQGERDFGSAKMCVKRRVGRVASPLLTASASPINRILTSFVARRIAQARTGRPRFSRRARTCLY